MDIGAEQIGSTSYTEWSMCRGDLPSTLSILRGIQGRSAALFLQNAESPGQIRPDHVQNEESAGTTRSRYVVKCSNGCADLLGPINKIEEVQGRSAAPDLRNGGCSGKIC